MNPAYPKFIPGTEWSIIDHIDTLSEDPERHTVKDLNMVESPEGDIYYDLREWSADHKQASYGFLLTEEEAQRFVDDLYEDAELMPEYVAAVIFEHPEIFNEFNPEMYEEETQASSETEREIPGQISIFDTSFERLLP